MLGNSLAGDDHHVFLRQSLALLSGHDDVVRGFPTTVQPFQHDQTSAQTISSPLRNAYFSRISAARTQLIAPSGHAPDTHGEMCTPESSRGIILRRFGESN